MKLNQSSTGHHLARVIQQFGAASLVRHQNGKYELLGGSPADHTAAHEWVSLFAHEIVFSQPGQKPLVKVSCRSQKKRFFSRFDRF